MQWHNFNRINSTAHCSRDRENLLAAPHCQTFNHETTHAPSNFLAQPIKHFFFCSLSKAVWQLNVEIKDLDSERERERETIDGTRLRRVENLAAHLVNLLSERAERSETTSLSCLKLWDIWNAALGQAEQITTIKASHNSLRGKDCVLLIVRLARYFRFFTFGFIWNAWF